MNASRLSQGESGSALDDAIVARRTASAKVPQFTPLLDLSYSCPKLFLQSSRCGKVLGGVTVNVKESPTSSDCCAKPCEKTTTPKEYVVKAPSRVLTKIRKMPHVSVDELVRLLGELPSSEFTSDGVADFLRRHPVSTASLDRYVSFEGSRYTRNLITANERFEVLLLCWDVGRATPIHNHEGQSCWVYVQAGRLSFTNYRWLGCDRKERNVHLEQLSYVPMAAEGSLNVIDEKDAIHRLANDESFGEKALSLHIYAKPLQTCVIYDERSGTCVDRNLFYDTRFGQAVIE